MNEATLLCDDLALLNKGHLVEQGSPKDIIQKYNTEKKVKLTYSDTSREIINFEALKEENYQKIMMIPHVNQHLKIFLLN